MCHWTDTLFKQQADRYAEFFEARFEDAGAEANGVLALADETCGLDPDRTLDLACGIGRHVVAFAERGCEAHGLDFSAAFVAEANERIEDRGLDDRATVRQHDMRNLAEWPESGYGLVTSFWNSLGYYGRDTDEAVLAEARRLLSADGVLAVELGNKDFYLANFEESAVSEDEDDDTLSVTRRDYDVETGRFHTRLDLFDAEEGYDHVDTMEWENRMYAPAVLRELLHDAGFEDVSLFGGFDGEEPTMASERVVALARKEGPT